MKNFLVLCLLLLSSTAWADCSNFDDCMDRCHGNFDAASGYCGKAIAYKLDEISNKLDKTKQLDWDKKVVNNPDGSQTIVHSNFRYKK